MNNKPLVSIITPSFNQAQYLEETILSVLNLEYNNIEYIIIDGGSTDGSVDIIKKYEDRLKAWISEPDKGQTDAINKGFGMAKGEFLAWINSDDTYLPYAVSEAISLFRENPELGLVYGDCNFIDKNGMVIGKFNAQQTNYRRLRRGGVYIPQQSSFFRADLWRKVGPLDPSFYFAMDYDLWVRLAREAPVLYHPGMWANFRLHDDAKTIADDERCWPEMLRVHKRDGGSVFSTIMLRHFFRRLLSPVINWRRRKMFS